MVSILDVKNINYAAPLRKQGYSKQRHVYPGMTLVNTFRIATVYTVDTHGHIKSTIYGAVGFVYTYPKYKMSRGFAITYEDRGAIYYDNNIEEKLGGEKSTLGQ